MKNWLPFILLSPLYAMAIVFLYWMFLSFTPAETLKVLDYPKELAAGDEISIVYDVTWHRTCNFFSRRYLQNGGTILLDSTEVFHSPRHEPHYVAYTRLPTNVQNGNYNLVAKVIALCNPYDYLFPTERTRVSLPIKINNEPTIPSELKILKKKIKQGEPLVFESTYTRRRICVSELQRFIYNESDVLVARDSRPGNAIGLGEQESKEEIIFSLPTGKYKLRSVNISVCPENTYRIVYPDREFEVVP